MIWQQVIYRIPNWSSLLSIQCACAEILPNSTIYMLLIDFKNISNREIDTYYDFKYAGKHLHELEVKTGKLFPD